MKRYTREDFLTIRTSLTPDDEHVHIADAHGQIERHRTCSRVGERRRARDVAVAVHSGGAGKEAPLLDLEVIPERAGFVLEAAQAREGSGGARGGRRRDRSRRRSRGRGGRDGWIRWGLYKWMTCGVIRWIGTGIEEMR